MILGLPLQLFDTSQKTCPYDICSFNTLVYIVTDKQYFSGIEGMDHIKVVSPEQKQEFGSIQASFIDSCRDTMPPQFCNYVDLYEFQKIENIRVITIGDSSLLRVRNFCIDSFPKLYSLVISRCCFSATPTCRNHLQQLQTDGLFCVRACPCLRKIVVNCECFHNVSHINISSILLIFTFLCALHYDLDCPKLTELTFENDSCVYAKYVEISSMFFSLSIHCFMQ